MSILGRKTLPFAGPVLAPVIEIATSGSTDLLVRAVEEVRVEVEDCLRKHRPAAFAWPTDGVMHEPWGYAIHVGWVTDWNKAGREGDVLDFIRKWMADDRNVLLALLWTACRDLINLEELHAR